MIPSVRTTAYIGVKLKAGSDQVLRAEFYFSTSKCILLLNCPKDAQYNKSECWGAQFFLWVSANTFFFSFSIKPLYCLK